ncbi:MAG: disulfide bond formation protein B [Phycisphaerae bacterium]|nr:disulfide bond formation protein B [Phycisphaerae bacterium]
MLQWYLLHIEVAGICGVLIGAFFVQFVEKELPCPLCMLQRMAMMLAAMGPFLLIGRIRSTGSVGVETMARAYGMSILAAVLGLVMSSRQVLLHILPGDPGYGSAVFGMHLYSWGVVVFLAVLVVSGLTMIMSRQLHIRKCSRPDSIATRIISWMFIVVIGANVVATFVESGFHPFLPDNPTGYELIE